MAIRACGEWKPKARRAIKRIFVFVDSTSAFCADLLDGGAALGSQRVEEAVHGGLVPPRRRPDQTPAIVVHDHSEIPMALAVADLIDTDPPQASEQVDALAGLVRDPLDDPARRPPGDTHQLLHRRLRAVRGQPGHRVVEVPAEAGLVAGPWHRSDDHPVWSVPLQRYRLPQALEDVMPPRIPLQLIRYLIHDRDTRFSGIGEWLKSAGTKSVLTSYRAPWQNGICERFFLSLQTDLLDHVIVFNEAHARRLITDYLGYYHEDRCHLSLDKDCPE